MNTESQAGSNIVITTIMKPQAANGVSVSALRLRDELVRQEIDCSLITPFDAGAAWLPIFAVRKLGLEKMNRDLGLRWFIYWYTKALKHALARHIRTKRLDAVLAQCPLTASVALELREELQMTFPVIMVKHFDGLLANEWIFRGMLTDDKLADRIRKLELDVIEEVDTVVYVSHWLRKSLESTLELLPRQSKVIWNGIDEAPERTHGFDRGHLNLTQNDLLLLNVGVIDPIKNQVNLVDLFKVVQSHVPHSHLLIVGMGPDAEKVAQKAADLGVAGNVHLIGNRTDVREIMKSADMYIHFSRTEALPTVILEAAQAGIPIAGVPVGGVLETMDVLGGTVQISHNNHEESFKALEPLLKDAGLRRSLGALNRNRFNQNFTVTASAENYLNLVSSLIRNRQDHYEEKSTNGSIID